MTSSERFMDASVFVHAYLKPKRPLKPQEVGVKEVAKRIVTRINGGERVLTSVAVSYTHLTLPTKRIV